MPGAPDYSGYGNLDAPVSSRATQVAADAIKAKTDLIPAGGPPTATDYTAARAAKLDNCDALVSTRAVDVASGIAPSAYPSVSINLAIAVDTLSAWVQHVASLSAEVYLHGVMVLVAGANDRELEVEVGIGTLGNEVEKQRGSAYAGAGETFFIPFGRPVKLANGSRVAIRAKSSHSSDSARIVPVWSKV